MFLCAVVCVVVGEFVGFRVLGDFVSASVWVLVLVSCVGLGWWFWPWFCFLWVAIC